MTLRFAARGVTLVTGDQKFVMRIAVSSSPFVKRTG